MHFLGCAHSHKQQQLATLLHQNPYFFFLALGLCFLFESSNKWTVAPSTVPGNMVKITGTMVGGVADALKVKRLAPALLCRLEKEKKKLFPQRAAT